MFQYTCRSLISILDIAFAMKFALLQLTDRDHDVICLFIDIFYRSHYSQINVFYEYRKEINGDIFVQCPNKIILKYLLQL